MIPKTATAYCSEDISRIENYEQAVNDHTQVWHCHHRKETDEGLTRAELIEMGLYYNRPASELIFLTPAEHSSLHRKGAHLSEEAKAKIRVHAKARTGEKNSFYGKHHTAEARAKQSAAKKGKQCTDEEKAKISATLKGRPSPMKGRHQTEEAKAKSSAAHKGKIPWNKGNPISEEHKAKLHLKCVWLTTDGEIIIMNRAMVFRWHPDWILLETAL